MLIRLFTSWNSDQVLRKDTKAKKKNHTKPPMHSLPAVVYMEQLEMCSKNVVSVINIFDCISSAYMIYGIIKFCGHSENMSA